MNSKEHLFSSDANPASASATAYNVLYSQMRSEKPFYFMEVDEGGSTAYYVLYGAWGLEWQQMDYDKIVDWPVKNFYDENHTRYFYLAGTIQSNAAFSDSYTYKKGILFDTEVNSCDFTAMAYTGSSVSKYTVTMT
jgi:hypothetical protein